MYEVPKFTVGVFGLVFDSRDDILLCHRRDHDLWNLPGGRLEPGETPWEGVVREIKEEVGLEVAVDRLAGVYSKPDVDEIVFSFICRPVGGMLSTSDESDRAVYFGVENIPSNTSSKQVERIKDALAGETEAVLKAQRGPSSIQLLREGKL
jgi:8-oxo-dGTP diphosphatase